MSGLGAAGKRLGGVLEDADELHADDLALLLGVGNALQSLEETRRGVDVFQPDVKIVAEEVLDRLRLAGAEEAVVDENAGQLVADGAVEQNGGHGGIDPAAESEDDALLPHPLANLGAGLLDERAHRPILLATADIVDKVLENRPAPRRVRDLRVKLQAVKFSLGIFERGVVAVLALRHDPEPRRQLRDLVAVTVPDIEVLGQRAEERTAGLGDGQRSLPKFAPQARRHLATEMKGKELDAIANAQDRNA